MRDGNKKLFIERINKLNYSLVKDFLVNPESCDNPSHYEDYLKKCAITDVKQGLGTTHLFIEEQDENKNVMGYVTLKATSLTKNVGENHALGYSAVEISELAVHKDYERFGVGRDLLNFVLEESYRLRNSIGVQYIVLCADPKAEGFYSKFNFTKIRDIEEVPREQWNQTCTPMLVKLQEKYEDVF